MKTISQNQFAEFMADTLPLLINSIMREDTSAVSKGQLSVPQFWALHFINESGGLTVNELAQTLNRSKSTTSGLLQRLEKNGLVKRERSTTDQRVVHISLTKKGHKFIDEFNTNRLQGIRNTYAPLTAAERMQHKEIMEKIIAHIKKLTPAIFIAGLLPFSSPAQTVTNQYTLEQSIQIGLKRSLTVANAARQKEIAQERRKGAISEALPTLSSQFTYTRNYPGEIAEFIGEESRSAGLEASWRVFSGGRTLAAIRASKAYTQLTEYQERRVRETQARDIALAYYAVLLEKARVDSLAQSVKQLSDFEAETRKKYEAGAVAEFDWLSAKVALANEQPRLIAAENSLSLAIEGFRNLTYIDDAQIELTDSLEYEPVKVDLDKAIQLGLNKRPELMEKNRAIKLRKEDITAQRAELWPKVDLFAAYSYEKPNQFSFITNDSGWQDTWHVGAQASWELFDGGRRSANIAESKLNMAIEEDEYRDLVRYVSLDVKTQWLRGRDAAEVIEATTETVQLAERALEIARSRFDAGLSTNLEVTQANVELSDARLARAIALHEYMAAVAGMKYAAGILLEEYE